MWTIIWIILAIVFIAIEVNTLTLASIWFAVGAVFAIISTLIVDDFLISFLVFAICSLISMIVLRPIARKYLDKTDNVKMNNDRIIGMDGIATADINSFDGEVKVDGKIWSARSDAEILKGDTVSIIRIEGVKLIVSKK